MVNKGLILSIDSRKTFEFTFKYQDTNSHLNIQVT